MYIYTVYAFFSTRGINNIQDDEFFNNNKKVAGT